MMRILFLTLIICANFSDGIFAQHISEEELRPLRFLVGEWKIGVEARLAKDGPWEKSEAHSVIRRIIGETIFEEEFSGSRERSRLWPKAG